MQKKKVEVHLTHRHNENLGVIIILAAAGLIVSLLSFISSILLKKEIACEIAGSFTCPQTGIYSALLGIPMSLWGIAFFIGIMLLANYLIKHADHTSYHHQTLYFASLIGAVFSFYLLIMQLSNYGAVCTFPCVVTLILAAAINILATRNLFYEHYSVGRHVSDKK